MAKLVDAPSSGGGAARCAGSSPVPGTKKRLKIISDVLFFYQTPLLLRSILHGNTRKIEGRFDRNIRRR